MITKFTKSIWAFLFVITVIAQAPQNNNDSDVIKQLIRNLYKIPNQEFLYSTASDAKISIEKTKKLYSMYYTEEIIDMIIKNIKDGVHTGAPFSENCDPRFAKEAEGCMSREKIIKLIIMNPEICKKSATITVKYATDQTDNNLEQTVYYFEYSTKGWKISDQWLGHVKYKNKGKIELKPDLKAHLKYE